MGQLDGRVAVITGAGGGLGREHALLFAAEGAKVVVNDVANAKEVVEEIRAAGGDAVAVEGSVAEMAVGEELVAVATEFFGDLHVVVNNAGVIRDAMLVNMTEEQFDLVVAVHLKGAFSVTRAAARYWRDRSKAGQSVDRAIVHTSSGSGLHGNVGQWNYSAVKAGLAIQVVNAARELDRYGVRANAIAPIARTTPVIATPGIGAAVAAPADPGRVRPLPPEALLAARGVPVDRGLPVHGPGLFCPRWTHRPVRRLLPRSRDQLDDHQWTVAELATEMGADAFPKSIDVVRQRIVPIAGAAQ
jgi:NAD(P)-dependent dehydrogenase (short-subunit alcohol dehydrogenase family)